MPPRVSAKAKALAKKALKQGRRDQRVLALKALVALATELNVTTDVSGRTTASSEVETLVRRLESRPQNAAQHARLRTAVELWVANGGRFTVPLADLDDSEAPPSNLRLHRILAPNFELQSKAFMLTYNSDLFTKETWSAFREFVEKLKKTYGARAWSACLELSLHAAVEKYHTHAYLLWTDGVGIRQRDILPFYFQDVRPRIDVCTQRWATTKPSAAALHGLWYVSVDKDGTQFTATNYQAGKWYKPHAKWMESLFQDGKLSHDDYLQMSAKVFPVGHACRKRDAEEALRDSRHHALKDMVKQELALLKSTGKFFTPRSFPQATAFVALFDPSEHLWRRPIFLILGGTGLGKSMLAATLLEDVGERLGLEKPSFVEVTVEGDGHLDLSDFDPLVHCGVLLDGVGDVLTLKQHRETLQGRPKICKGAKSATMKHAYAFTLVRRAVVVTMDSSAANLDLLQSDHWLANDKNIVQLHLTAPAFNMPVAAEPAPAALSHSQLTQGAMAQWSANQVMLFLKERDLAGPASTLYTNGANGQDLLDMNMTVLTQELRLSSFAAKKVLCARDAALRPAS